MALIRPELGEFIMVIDGSQPLTIAEETEEKKSKVFFEHKSLSEIDCVDFAPYIQKHVLNVSIDTSYDDGCLLIKIQ